MFQAIKSHKSLNDVSDVARLMGLSRSASLDQIARSFGVLTNFDTQLAIEENHLEVSEDEVWEIKVSRTSARPAVQLRQNCRGPWKYTMEDIPSDVRRHFKLREQRSGSIETVRPWAHWVKADWLKGSGRRLKSRCGEVHAVVEVSDVRRPSGMSETSLRLDPVVDEDMQRPESLHIPLPCSVGSLSHAVDSIRSASVAHAA